MFRLLFQLSIRNLFRKNTLFTFINISGLAIGIACFLLVALFITDEYSFDKYHRNADRIYRIVLDFTSDGSVTNWAKTSAPIGNYLTGAFPEIEQVVRLRKNPGTDLLAYNDIQFYEEKLFFADSTLFSVFDFKLIKGNPLSALSAKHSIIISESLARKYFDREDPLGKSFRFNNQLDLTITGIIEDIPDNSHFVADAFITFSSLDDLLGEKRLTHWGQFDHYTYALLSKGARHDDIESKLPQLLKRNAPEWVSEKEALFLQPLTSIHLNSHRKDEITANSKETYSHILAIIACFILLMASINFINLTTATQLSRFKEIAIQKILGANKYHLTLYAFTESQIICVMASIFAIIIGYLALPTFNLITGKHISITHAEWILILAVSVAIIVGLLSSSVPLIQALRASSVQGSKQYGTRIRTSTLRTSLVIFQFTISILLIICTSVAFSQFTFLKSMRLGFNGEDIVVIPVKDRTQNDRYAIIVNELNQLSGIQRVSFSSSTPACNNSLTYTYSFVGTEIKDRSMATFIIDENFVDLFEIKLKEGRIINPSSTDTLSDVLLNVAAVEQLKLSEPIGQLITGKVKGRIVGVVENFNHTSLHSGIEPIIMYAYLPTFRFVSVKLTEGEISKGLSSLKNKWPEIYAGYPVEYSFLQDQIEQLYGSELQLSRAYTLFSIVAIIISGIGLIGLTTFSITRKRKEISIRKVFGSSTFQLIGQLYSDYLRIILIAVFISWTIGFYWMNEWLTGFAFKTELRYYHFIVPAVIMICIVFISTGIQTFKASITNPIKNLRDE